MEKEKILALWYKCIGDLYNDNRGKMPVSTTESESPITFREVEHTLKEIPMKKERKRLQTTQSKSGGAVTNCYANCVDPSRPQQWGPDLPVVCCQPCDPLDGWRCSSQKRVMSRLIQARQH